MKPNSNQETAVGGGGECSGGTQEALPEGINWKETHMEISCHPYWNLPAVDRGLSWALPSMATHSCPDIIQLLVSLLKKLLNIDFYNVCFADDVSPEYHEITGFSYKVLMHV